jgi:hypothetical protein
MASNRTLLHYARYTHLYLGVFIAPALFFFAFTGALQTFSFHETTRGSSYKPPAWIATLAQIHKKQTTIVPVHKTPPPMAAPTATASPKGDRTPAGALSKACNPMPLKLFFLVVSVGLFLSTLTGLYMSYRYSRNRRLITAILVAGVVLPIALLFV